MIELFSDFPFATRRHNRVVFLVTQTG